MNLTSNHEFWMWLSLILVATFSIINLYLFLKILKKYDDSSDIIVRSIEILSNQSIKVSNEIELLKRRDRITNGKIEEKRKDRQ